MGWCDGGGAALVSSGGGRPERCPAGAGTPAGVAGGFSGCAYAMFTPASDWAATVASERKRKI